MDFLLIMFFLIKIPSTKFTPNKGQTQQDSNILENKIRCPTRNRILKVLKLKIRLKDEEKGGDESIFRLLFICLLRQPFAWCNEMRKVKKKR